MTSMEMPTKMLLVDPKEDLITTIQQVPTTELTLQRAVSSQSLEAFNLKLISCWGVFLSRVFIWGRFLVFIISIFLILSNSTFFVK